MSENNESLPQPVSAMSVVDGTESEPDNNEPVVSDDDTKKVRRVSERLPLLMTRKNDKVVVGSAVVTVYDDHAEISGRIIGSEEAGEAAALFSSNIIGGISIGAILTPEAANKIANHLKS